MWSHHPLLRSSPGGSSYKRGFRPPLVCFEFCFHKLYLMILCSSIGRFCPLEIMCSSLGSYQSNFSCQIELSQHVLFCTEILFNVQVCVDET